MESIQTSEEEDIIDDFETDDNPTDESEEEETEEEVAPSSQEVDYRVKFTESSKEAQRLYEENKALQAKLVSAETTASQQITKQEEERMKDENPEAFKLMRMEQSLRKMEDVVLSDREERAIDSFTKAIPEADTHREALKKLGRVDPNKSYQDIWNEYFKPAYDKTVKVVEEKTVKAKKSQAETGRGSVSGEPSADLFNASFSSLSLEKRKEALKRAGY